VREGVAHAADRGVFVARRYIINQLLADTIALLIPGRALRVENRPRLVQWALCRAELLDNIP
jgi:hypothetical protein